MVNRVVAAVSPELHWSDPVVRVRSYRHRLIGTCLFVLLIYSLMLPPELRISFDGQVIYAYRAVEFMLLPIIIIAALRQSFRPTILDLTVIFSNLWILLSFGMLENWQVAVVRGGILVFDFLVAYFAARLFVTSLNDLRRLLIYVLPGVLAAAFFMFLESVSHTYLVRPAAASIFGNVPVFQGGEAVGIFEPKKEVRLGLMRSMGPFSHPILGGVFLISFLTLYLNSRLRGWFVPLGVAAALCGIFSFSSAVLLAIIIVAVLHLVDWAIKNTSLLSWGMFAFVTTAGLAFLQLATEKGIAPFLGQFTLNPQTASFRRLIWHHGLQSVENNPLIGIGYQTYERLPWMPPTVDTHWLMLAIRHGVIPSIGLLAVSLIVIGLLFRRYRASTGAARATVFGLLVAQIILVVCGFTVAFFGTLGIWFATFLGICVSIGMGVQYVPSRVSGVSDKEGRHAPRLIRYAPR